MGHCGLMICLLLLPATCLAAPWGYELPIGDGYSIVVSTTISALCAEDGRVVLDPGDYHASRIDQYATTRGHVFIRGYTAFFIPAKTDDSVVGPFSEFEFAQHPVVLASEALHWRQPHHPHPYSAAILWCLLNPAFDLGAALVLLFIVATLLMAVRCLRHARPEALD